MKVVLAGPPRSGKSCLRQGLKDAVRRIPGAPYPYVITGCPDGEGAWFQETVETDPVLAAACKLAYKAKFTPEFVSRVAESVRNCLLELTLVDIGGIPSAENRTICAAATHIIILMPAGMQPDKFADLQARYRACELDVPANLQEVFVSWEKFAGELGLAVIADIVSDYHGTGDIVEGVGLDGVLRGSVHRLERGENVSERPMVVALTEHLVDLSRTS